jgi:hypothetical protein
VDIVHISVLIGNATTVHILRLKRPAGVQPRNDRIEQEEPKNLEVAHIYIVFVVLC